MKADDIKLWFTYGLAAIIIIGRGNGKSSLGGALAVWAVFDGATVSTTEV